MSNATVYILNVLSEKIIIVMGKGSAEIRRSRGEKRKLVNSEAASSKCPKKSSTEPPETNLSTNSEVSDDFRSFSEVDALPKSLRSHHHRASSVQRLRAASKVQSKHIDSSKWRENLLSNVIKYPAN